MRVSGQNTSSAWANLRCMSRLFAAQNPSSTLNLRSVPPHYCHNMRIPREMMPLLSLTVVLISMAAITPVSRAQEHEDRFLYTGQHQSMLKQCINEGYLPKLLSWQECFVDCVPSLRMLGTWWSSRPRRIPITIITHASISRLPQLQAQCQSWKGPISVVLYTSTILSSTTPSAALSDLLLLPALRKTTIDAARFADTVERDASMLCQLDLMLVVEVFSGSRTALLYPYNALRNLARIQARTPLVAVFDVDLVISPHLADVFSNLTASAQLLSLISESSETTTGKTGGARGMALVVPVFQTNATLQRATALTLVDSVLAGSKVNLLQEVKDRNIMPFDFHRFRAGHYSTRYDKWYLTGAEPYEVKPASGYEPYIIVDRVTAPWHDSRYRGYGWDKIIQIQMMIADNYKFLVHPTAFLVHRPHHKSEVSKRFWVYSDAMMLVNNSALPKNYVDGLKGWARDGADIKEFNQAMNKLARKDLKKGTYQIVLDPATLRCRDQLSWWAKESTEAA